MNQTIIDFILTHENDEVPKLLLQHKEILGYPASFVANQINGRQRAKRKLPTWYSIPAIVYPPQQNLEQCSSEVTAQFKCEVVSRASSSLLADKYHKATLADLTGGFGVDSFFFGAVFSKVYHVEPDVDLHHLAKKNFELLKAQNIEHLHSTAEAFLSSTSTQLDWLYLDPSRKSNGKKIVKLTDSQPDVVMLLPLLYSKANNILIKTSPLLDLKAGMHQLPGTKEIFVFSVGNECKEVLFRLEKGWSAEPEIVCVNLHSNEKELFSFRFSEEAAADSAFSEPLTFVYEPSTSILKAGAFKTIAKAYNLFKISINTHFYTGHKLLPDFPGRVFQIQSALSATAGTTFNIISRNHPLSADEIKKKFKLKDGGEKYLLAFSRQVKKYLLVANRIK